MGFRIARPGLLAAWFCACALVSLAAAATPCTALTQAALSLPAPATIVSFVTQDVTSGVFQKPGGGIITGLPAFCRVAAVVSSSGDPATTQAAMEVWMPQIGGDLVWNGRYLGTGNGGFGGSVSYSELQTGLEKGFSAANSDMGTGILFGCDTEYCGNRTPVPGVLPGGLYGNPAAIVDFGYQATHLMSVAGLQLTTAYYGQPPGKKYFEGCSTGGGQAMTESQRFPDDYDGILAGAPAHNSTHLHMAGTEVFEATHTRGDAYLTNAALALAHAKVLAQCAGQDGGLATDDFLTRPASCMFDAAALQCTGAANEVPCTSKHGRSCTCFAPNQVGPMNLYWNGTTDSAGKTLYPGAERGAEEPAPPGVLYGANGNLGLPWQQLLPEPAFDSLMFWAEGAAWRWQDLFAVTTRQAPEIAAAIAAIDSTAVGSSTFAATLNAVSTNLKAFSRHGGKLLMYQGYADPLIPSATSIDYLNAVTGADPKHVSDYLRLFLAPGVWHCSGGPGANVFGNSGTTPPLPLDASDDVLGALIAWVEQGVAPSEVIATKFEGDLQSGPIAFQRPLCLYPANAAYQGGDVTKASSFRCLAGQPVTNQGFSKIYGP